MTRTVDLDIPHSAEDRAQKTTMTSFETMALEQQVEALSLKIEDLGHEIERLRAALQAIHETVGRPADARMIHHVMHNIWLITRAALRLEV